MQRESTSILFAADLPAQLTEFFVARLGSSPGISLTFPPDFEEATIESLAAAADVIVGWRCTPQLLTAATNLKLWIFPGVGVQRLIEPFTELNLRRKVILTNCHGNTYATAQHAVALLLATMNAVVTHDNWMRSGNWRKGDDDAASTTLRNKLVGLLGYGGVNSKVHRFLAGYDVEFAILRNHRDKADTSELPGNPSRYTTQQLEQFLSAIDVLMVALPETGATRGLIGLDELQLLGSGGFLVNVGRGPVVVEQALYDALENRWIAAAGIDVWYDYRPDPDEQGRLFPFSRPFHELDNIVLSPHRAASPIFDPVRWEEVVEIIVKFVCGEELINVVNLEEGY